LAQEGAPSPRSLPAILAVFCSKNRAIGFAPPRKSWVGAPRPGAITAAIRGRFAVFRCIGSVAQAQVLSGAYTRKDPDGVPTARPPAAASDYRNRSRRSPGGSFRSFATARTPRRGDAAAPDRVGDRLYRAKDVGRAVDRRQRELDGAVAPRRDVRSRQSRNAVGSPARASSTALRLSAVASPSSNRCAARVDKLIEPRGRPPGFPDCPFAKVDLDSFLLLLLFPAEKCRSSLHLDPSSWRQPPDALWRRIPCDYGNFIVAARGSEGRAGAAARRSKRFLEPLGWATRERGAVQ
jgi:hypothetical protein